MKCGCRSLRRRDDMLNENDIDRLIQPLIDRQREIENTVITAVSRRIRDIKAMLPSDVYKLEVMYKNGSDAREINKKISELTRVSENEIRAIIQTAAQENYKDAKPFYDYRELPYIPYEQNEALQNTVKAVERVTLGDYENLSNSTAFMLRDTANPRIIRPTPLSETYRTVIDRAIQSAVMGAESYGTLIPDAIRDLADKGITAVEYTSEKGAKRRIRLDTVVRRNILDGIRNVGQAVQDEVGRQFGADGVELSVHQYSAPDHEPIQGRQFTNEEYDKLQTGMDFKDTTGTKFKGIERAIGMWNCRHLAYSIIIGEATPNYTIERLEGIKRKNADGITVKDRGGADVKKSMYWCTQRQRQYELEIRRAKEGAAAARLAGEEKLEEEYNAKVYRIQNRYKAFCKRCGLSTRFENTRIYVDKQ